MNDERPLPPAEPDPSAASQLPDSQLPAAAPIKRRMPLSRILLFALLAVCLGMLAFDNLAGRIPQHRAYVLLNERLLPDDKAKTDSVKGKGVIGKNVAWYSPDDVHKLLGRQPQRVVNNPAEARQLMHIDGDPEADKNPVTPALVEIYRYPGALRSYYLRVSYAKPAVTKGGPAYILSGLKTVTE